MVGAHPFRIGKSPIHGRGVFAARPIPKGELIGVAILRIGRGEPDKALRQTILSRYLNHADEPNAAMVPIHGGFGLLALGDIPEDNEIVVDYDRTGRTVEPEPFPAYQDFDPDPIKADPRIRTLGRAGSFKIIEVDGPAIRDSLDADFPGLGHHSSFPFIPTGEFWIDREAVPEGLSLFEGQLSRRAGTLRLEPSTRGWERYREPFWFAPPQKEPPPGFQPELSYPGDPDEGGFRWADVGTEKTPGAFVLGQPLARWLFGKLNSRGWTVPGLILDTDKGIFPSLLDPHGRPVRIGKFLSSLRKKLPSGSRDAALADEVLHQYEIQPKETEWRLIVSAEPADLRGISTGRGWSSCMALKPGERKECLESSIGARDMVAYAVDRNGQWLARSVLRFDGKGHWWPEKAYGQPSSIRLDLFLDKVRQWLKERDLLGKEGEFSPFFQGPSDWRTQNRGPRAERTVERPEESMEFPERYRGTGHSLKPETMAKWPRRVRIVVDDVVFELPGEFGKPQDVGRTLRDIGVWLQDPKAPGRAKFLDIDEEGPAVLAEVWDNQGLRRIKSHPLVEAIIDEDTNMALALCAFPLSKRAKMSRLERREVTRWIEENVSDPKNHCFFYAAVMAALFPGFTLMRGWNTGQFRDGRLVEQGDTGHFWLEDEEGNSIDPTAPQYPGGRNFGGAPVSLAANLPEAIKDPLFKTLSSDDQEKVLAALAAPVSGRHIDLRRWTSIPISRRAAIGEDVYRAIARELVERGRSEIGRRYFGWQDSPEGKSGRRLMAKPPAVVREYLDRSLPKNSIVQEVEGDEGVFRVVPRRFTLPHPVLGRWIHVVNIEVPNLKEFLPRFMRLHGEVCFSSPIGAHTVVLGGGEEFLAVLVDGPARTAFGNDVYSDFDPWTGRRHVSGKPPMLRTTDTGIQEAWVVPSETRLVGILTNDPEYAKEAGSMGVQVFGAQPFGDREPEGEAPAPREWEQAGGHQLGEGWEPPLSKRTAKDHAYVGKRNIGSRRYTAALPLSRRAGAEESWDEPESGMSEEEERQFEEYWDRLDRQIREEEARRPKRKRSEMTLEEIEFLAEMDPEEREEFLSRNFLSEEPPLSKRTAILPISKRRAE